MSVRNSKRAKSDDVKYFVDTGRVENHCCKEKVSALRVNEFEAEVVDRIRSKLDSLTLQKSERTTDNRIPELITQKEKVSSDIESLLNNLTLITNQAAISHIEKRIAELDREKNEIESQITAIKAEQESKQINHKKLHNVMSKWSKLSFDDKRSVVDLLIEKIDVYTDRIQIIWRV